MDTVTSDVKTHYFWTLQPYYNDRAVLADPGRDNSADHNRGMWLGQNNVNYWFVGSAYMFYDPVRYAWGQAARTRFDDVVVPTKSLLTNCVGEPLCCDFQPALFGEPGMFDHVGGGVNNDNETFVFVDGHGSYHSTKPIVEWWLSTTTYALTYPPNVSPSEAQWWTMPFYPDRYPYNAFDALP